MKISYDKLWKLMKKIKIQPLLRRDQQHSFPLVRKMRLCKVFHCDIGDVMEMIEDED